MHYEADYRWLSQVYVSVQPTTGQGQLHLARAGRQDHRADPRERPRRGHPRRPGRDRAGRRTAGGGAEHARSQAARPRRSRSRWRPACASTWTIPASAPCPSGWRRSRSATSRGSCTASSSSKRCSTWPRDLLQAEKETPPEEDEDRGKAALTELFEEVRNEETPIIVERVVNDIDEIVRFVRFPGWQTTSAGEREVRKALRKTLFKYKLHQDAELFDKAYGYVRQYY